MLHVWRNEWYVEDTQQPVSAWNSFKQLTFRDVLRVEDHEVSRAGSPVVQVAHDVAVVLVGVGAFRGTDILTV